MYVSDMLREWADEVEASGADRDLTSSELESLKSVADGFEESPTAKQLLGNVGQAVDGWTSPISVCVAAIWNWLKNL